MNHSKRRPICRLKEFLTLLGGTNSKTTDRVMAVNNCGKSSAFGIPMNSSETAGSGSSASPAQTIGTFRLLKPRSATMENQNWCKRRWTMDEHRIAARQRVLKAGTIALAGGGGVNCVLRNLSQTGACLEVTNPIGIPDTFGLVTGATIGIGLATLCGARRSGSVLSSTRCFPL